MSTGQPAIGTRPDSGGARGHLAIFLVLVGVYILSQFFRAFLAVVAGDLRRDLALGPADLGSLSAAWFAAFALAQIPLGVALDRVGPRLTLSAVMLLAVVGAAWLALARGFGDALAAMTLIGLGCAPILMAGFYVVARLYPPHRFATMSSLLLGIGSLGDPLSAAPLAAAIALFGWRPTIGAIAVLTLLGAAGAGLFLRDPGLEARGRARDRGSYREILSIRALWPVLPLIFVSYAVLISVRGLWIAPFLDAVHGFGTVAQGWAALFMGLAMGAGALLYAPIERAVRSPKRVALGGAVLTAVNCVALGLVGANHAGVAVALLVAIGLTGVSYAILMAHVRPFLPARSLGRGVTFTNFVFMAGAGLAQWVSGRFVQASEAAGSSPEATFERLFVALGLVLLAACAVYATSPPGPPYPIRPAPAP